jgi:hypothetical protein
MSQLGVTTQKINVHIFANVSTSNIQQAYFGEVSLFHDREYKDDCPP